jgi:Putative MetA-pathway of phenol degradation
MSNFIKSTVLILVFFTSYIKAQTIQTDRPDQTETPYLVPKNYLQVENGFSIENNKSEGQVITIPSSLWRFGLYDKIELRLITEFNKTSQFDYGMNPITIGVKWQLTEEKKWLPKTSLITHLSLNSLASTHYKLPNYGASFRFVMQHTLNDKATLSYNLGAQWDEISMKSTYLYTLTTGYTLSKKWGSYIELYGYVSKNETASHNFDGGLTYLISNDFMLDLSYGVGIMATDLEKYYAFGVSYRFDTK